MAIVFAGRCGAAPPGPSIDLPWPAANEILARAKPPTFPDRTFSLLDFGAKPDGTTDATAAFTKAIAACADAGGGHVVVPAGTYLSGAIQLKSNVDLHLDGGATILFSGDPSLYPPRMTRNEGLDVVTFSPLVYARGQTNIALTGSGTLDGAATSKWNKQVAANRALLQEMAARGVPIEERTFGPDRPIATTFVEPYDCKNVLIQGITIKHSHWWQMHPTLCTNVTIDGVTADGTVAHTDGCDPESCEDVVIENCTLTAGDDCIAVKAGRNPDAQRVHKPCRNLVIVDTKFDGNWGLIACGSEQTEGIENVYGYRLTATGDRQKFALYLKTNTLRGGYLRHIHLDGVTGHFTRAVCFATLRYGKETGPTPPEVDDITLSHFSVESAPTLLDARGLPDDPIGSIKVGDSTFAKVDHDSTVENVKSVTYEHVTVNGQPAHQADR